MNRAMLERHLAFAEAHVVQGKRLIEQQRVLIERLKVDGHDTREAERLLSNFRDAQAQHVHQLELVRHEIAASKE